jgi:hypothetical protein
MFTLRQRIAWGHNCASHLPYCGVPSAPIDTIGIQTNTCFVNEGKKQFPLIVLLFTFASFISQPPSTLKNKNKNNSLDKIR